MFEVLTSPWRPQRGPARGWGQRSDRGRHGLEATAGSHRRQGQLASSIGKGVKLVGIVTSAPEAGALFEAFSK